MIAKARTYRHVLVDAPRLARASADADAFAEDFDGADVVAFDNLGRDARLVVPAPLGPPQLYAHLLAAIRGAPATQMDELLARVGSEASERLRDWPVVWVSTSGLGVAWLHARIDARPKYFTHAPYRARPTE